MSITITAKTYQAWGVAAPVSDNTSFKGWCSILNGVYTGYTAQYITRKIHYVQTGISVYNDSGIQSYFNKERTIESSIYVDSANFTDDFNIELEIASIFNPTSDRNFYYYVEYIDSNDKTLTYFPKQSITDNGTWEKKSYYGICRANSLKQDNSFVYTTDKFEEGTAINKEFDGNGQLLTISVGRYITLKLSKDDSVKKVSVTMELYSETEKIGKIPKLNIAYFVLTNKDKTTNRILRIEIPVEYLSAFQDANISYGLIIVSEQTNYGLNKKFDFKVDCEPLQNISDNIQSTKDKYYFFNDFSNGNIEFLFPSRDSDGNQPSLSNKTLRDIKPQLKYGKKIIELLDENSNVIWTDDQFTQSFDNDNYLTKAKYTLQKEFFDNIIINNVSPEDCYGDKSFYFCYEIMDEKGLIYNKEVEVLVNFIKEPAITLQGIDFINKHGERIRYNPNSESHYFMNKMTISPMIEITCYTSEDIEFQLYTKADSGPKINSHGEIETKKCLNSDAFGKISKQGITITYNFLTNVSIDRSNYTIQTGNFINLNWYLKYRLTKKGQELDTSNNLLKSKGHFLYPPKISEPKIEASIGTGITFSAAAIKPSSTMANPSTTNTIFELIGDVDDTIVKSNAVTFEKYIGTFSVPLLNTISVKVKVSYEHTVSFSENGKDYSFTAIEFTETSGTTLTGPTPTIAYRKNCLGINVDQVQNDAVLVIQSLTAKNKIYLGDRGKITISENTIKLENFTIDCGTW